MKLFGPISRGSLTLLAAIAVAALSVAAQEGGNSSQHVMSPFGFKWVHFVIVAIAIYWVFGKALPPIFRRNADNISEAISKATLAKAEAERQLQEASTKLAGLEQEMAKFRAQAQKDAAAELDRLRTLTKLDAEKIGAAAKAEIEAAERAARVELKELAAKLAMDRAESLVAKELTPAVQEAMLNGFVQSLQGRPN
jgi:F0F1-type ATP synthase membrane subunit b/b'